MIKKMFKKLTLEERIFFFFIPAASLILIGLPRWMITIWLALTVPISQCRFYILGRTHQIDEEILRLSGYIKNKKSGNVVQFSKLINEPEKNK